MNKPELKWNLVVIPALLIMAGLVVIFAGEFLVYYGNFQDFGKEISVLNNKLDKSKLEVEKYKQELRKHEKLRFKLFTFKSLGENFDYMLDEVYIAAQKYKLSPYLVISIIKIESNFNPTAQSFFKNGMPCAYGLMQINLSHWRKPLSIDDSKIFEIPYNLDLGCKIFRHYLDMAGGDIARALFFYNNGPSGRYNNVKYAPAVLRTVYYKNGVLAPILMPESMSSAGFNNK